MGTIGNIVARVGADVSPLSEDMKKAQNTILTFKNESLAALKSFGLPHINSTNLVESIQSGQRVIVNFAQESGETLTQFQERVRATFAEAGIDITAYEKVLADANQVHAEFAKGAVKNFQAVSAAAEEVNNKAEELQNSLGKSFSGISANFNAFKDSISNAFKTMADGSASFGEKIGAVGQSVVDGFGLMTGAIEVFIAVEVVKKVGEWIGELKDLAAETQDVEHRFAASTGVMNDKATEFSESLAKSYGLLATNIEDMMGKEYLNNRMMGFDPTQAEEMSEYITQLSYDLGKLRGQDPSTVFDALQRGMMGQTRGLKQLGIAVTTTDLKNLALSEGVIKQGQTLTTAQTAMMAYQEIVKKTAAIQGYYKTTADDLSTQQTKLNAGWQEMKEKLAGSLTPAFTGLLKVLNVVATGFETLVEGIATAIQYISLFVEDAYSGIKDTLSLNFGAIHEDWTNNYNSIFNSSEAAKQYGEAMDNSLSATNAGNEAQQKLGKSLNANTMSFDELHNITNSGAAAAGAQTDAVNKLADALGNLKDTDLSNLTNNQAKGIVLPVSFKVPPMPPLPPPPAVTVTAVDKVTPVLANVKAELNAWKTGINQDFIEVQKTVTAWETSTEKSFGKVQTTIAGWETAAVNAFAQFAVGAARGFSAAGSAIHGWSTQAATDFSTFATGAETAISTFATRFVSDFSLALSATETRVTSWATAVEQAFTSAMSSAVSSVASLASAAGQSLSSIGSRIGNWANNNKSWLVPLGVAAGAVGLTIATGGTDLIAGGIAAAGSTLAGIGASLAAVPAMAAGGIVTAPTLAMIGEGGGPEAVIPLDKLSGMMGGHTSANTGTSNQSNPSQQPIIIKLDGRTLARALYSYTVNENDRLGTTIGYNSSYNLPK